MLMSVIFKVQVPHTYQASNQIWILQIYVLHTIAFLFLGQNGQMSFSSKKSSIMLSFSN